MTFRLMHACVVAALLAPLPALAQTDATLETTLGFIRDQMAAQNNLQYSVNLFDTATSQSWGSPMSAVDTNVTVDLPNCAVRHHWFTTRNGETIQDFDSAFLFAQGRKVAVTNREQEIRTQAAADGHPTWVSTVSPQVWVVAMTTDSGTHVLDFTDEDVADRVARAMEHAMDLCGAKRDAF